MVALGRLIDRKARKLESAMHRWFFFEPIDEAVTPVPDGSEFSDWTWIDPDELIERVVGFRKAPYRQVLGG